MAVGNTLESTLLPISAAPLGSVSALAAQRLVHSEAPRFCCVIECVVAFFPCGCLSNLFPYFQPDLQVRLIFLAYLRLLL